MERAIGVQEALCLCQSLFRRQVEVFGHRRYAGRAVRRWGP